MSDKAAIGKVVFKKQDVHCPRDRVLLKEQVHGEATLDVCTKCGGQFFDSGEMFKAFGLKADPSYWDRPETGGAVKDGHLHCPKCHAHMLVQDVKFDTQQVEIDRCGHCGGVWLDKGEVDKIIAIGVKLQPVIEAERAQAQAELAKLGEIGCQGLIARFFKLFQ